MCTGARVCVFESVPISMPMHTCSSYINSCMVYCLAVLVWVWQCNTPITFCHTLVRGVTPLTRLFFHFVQHKWQSKYIYRLFCFIDIKTCMRCDFISFFISLPIFLPQFQWIEIRKRVFSNSFRNERFFQPTRTHKWCSLPFTKKKKKANGTTMVEIIISLIRICLLVRRESTYVFQRHFSQYGASPVTM